jgi:hypothetical protein
VAQAVAQRPAQESVAAEQPPAARMRRGAAQKRSAEPVREREREPEQPVPE